MQHKAGYLLFCKFTLHVSGVNPDLAALEEGCGTKNMTSTEGCSYSFVYS